jgi:hypothetical protein
MRRDDVTRVLSLDGARLFDAGAFFEAHEAWEEHWRVEKDEVARRFLQGLIQIAAGFHKWTVMHDSASAARLLDKGLAKLIVSADATAEARLAPFKTRVRACAAALSLGHLDVATIPKLGA